MRAWTDHKLHRRLAWSLVLFFGAACARAENEPELFGAIDLAALYSSAGQNAPHRTAIESGAHDGSHIGWRQREPIAPGYSALIFLAYGLAPDTNSGIGSVQFGSPSRAYQSAVGIATPFGEFKAGRLPSPANSLKRFDPLVGNKFSALAALLPMVTNLGADPTRFNNAVSYASPVVEGWQANALYALAPYAGDTAADGNRQERAAIATLLYAGTRGNAFVSHQVTSHLGGALAAIPIRVGDTSVAAAWNFDAWRLSAIGIRSDRREPGAHRVIDHAEVGLLWHLAASDDLGLQLARLTEHDRSDANARSLALHYDHFLSKRTTLYTGYNLTRNDNNARYAADQFNRPLGGKTSRLIGAGVQHTF